MGNMLCIWAFFCWTKGILRTPRHRCERPWSWHARSVRFGGEHRAMHLGLLAEGQGHLERGVQLFGVALEARAIGRTIGSRWRLPRVLGSVPGAARRALGRRPMCCKAKNPLPADPVGVRTSGLCAGRTRPAPGPGGEAAQNGGRDFVPGTRPLPRACRAWSEVLRTGATCASAVAGIDSRGQFPVDDDRVAGAAYTHIVLVREVDEHDHGR